MALATTITTRGLRLREVDGRRIRHQMRSLRRRLAHQAAPRAILALERHESERRITANLRVQLGPLGTLLFSTRDGETAAHAGRLAHERGEASFVVPSGRLPAALRPLAVARLYRDERLRAEAGPSRRGSRRPRAAPSAVGGDASGRPWSRNAYLRRNRPMEPGHEPPRDAPSAKVRIAASAGGIIAGAGAAVASLTHNPATRTRARRLAGRVGKALAERLGETPHQRSA